MSVILWAWVENLHSMVAVSLEVCERSCVWLFGGCTLPSICFWICDCIILFYHAWICVELLRVWALKYVLDRPRMSLCSMQKSGLTGRRAWAFLTIGLFWCDCWSKTPGGKGKALWHLEIRKQKSQASFLVSPEGTVEFWLAPSRNLLSQNRK